MLLPSLFQDGKYSSDRRNLHRGICFLQPSSRRRCPVRLRCRPHDASSRYSRQKDAQGVHLRVKPGDLHLRTSIGGGATKCHSRQSMLHRTVDGVLRQRRRKLTRFFDRETRYTECRYWETRFWQKKNHFHVFFLSLSICSFQGNVSFGLKRYVPPGFPRQTNFWFPNVFTNVQSVMDGDVRFYCAVKTIQGRAFKYDDFIFYSTIFLPFFFL